tara:strand:+ start:272 stop:472 length:201 start_codon:yes stop_codon:yes gene_type:complete
MSEITAVNSAGIVFFALSIVGIILAVMRKRIRFRKLTKISDSDDNTNVNEMLDDLNDLARSKDDNK